ncbi:transglutaminase-like cysteine peptidase [Microvirga pudoricolor]|uniref:transglutaminase-like cysteine peptidase n=1 Tax=Microvirga pudoricolor TaxID=2778729 RepID=UPI00194E0D80|nr:transglutaminase-like cysteine peptidase [Microvirga pudoricolor]MBM6596001.1 transglutaminase-like cysteine peptidase [Microvirga pudoricolor]
MGRHIFKIAFLGFALVSGSAVQAQTVASLPSGGQPIQNSGTAKPILGWVKFCEKNPAECAVNSNEPRIITLTSQVWNAIVSVNKRVNAEVKPVTDQDHLGVVDYWSFPIDGKGDCEDYQLLKRKLLADLGLPRRAMRMTVVIDELGEGHAVLMVRTDKGDYILDNKTSAVLSWDQTGYAYVKRESQEASAWVSLGGITTSPTTTANK